MNDKDNIYILIDNDADDSTKELINELGVSKDHQFVIGNKEFEDSFKPETIYYCWKEHVESKGNKLGELWTKENIEEKRNECLKKGKMKQTVTTCLNVFSGL